MKKLKKIMAGIMAMTMFSSLAATNVSAEILSGTTETIIIAEKSTVTKGFKNCPVKQTVTTEYKGILVTMPDGEAPTAEELGLESCEITTYNPDTTFIGLGGIEGSDGLYIGTSLITPAGSEKTYLVNSEEIPEESAENFVKKLKIREIVSTADIFYETQETCEDFRADYQYCYISVDVNETEKEQGIYTEISEEQKSEFCGLKEIEGAGFEVGQVVITKSSYYNPTKDFEYWISIDYNEYKDDIKLLYDELRIIIDEIDENYAEDENYIEAQNGWVMPVTTLPIQNGLLAVDLTWGDATNDDVIDLYDAIEISKHIMGIGELDEDTILLADINRDGVTNLYDAVEIAKGLM